MDAIRKSTAPDSPEGVAQVTVSRWEKGFPVQRRHWKRMAELAGSTVATFFFGEATGPLERRKEKERSRTLPATRPGPGLLNAKEAAERLRISVGMLRRLIRAGDLQYISIGHGKKAPRMRFTQEDIDAFIARQTRRNIPLASQSRSRSDFGPIKGFTERMKERERQKRR